MRPSERLTALFLLALSASSAVLAPGPSRLLVLLVLFLATWLLARTGARGGPLGVARELVLPAVVVVATFAVLEPLIEAVHASRLDPLLAATDARWFGPLVAAWQEALGRPAWLTDLAYLAYVSFYLLPVAAFLLARPHGARPREATAFCVLFGFYASYLGYLVWPASGPRLPPAEEAALGGGLIAEAIRWFLARAEATVLDAFPSGHTALSLVAATLGARQSPRLAPALFAWAAAVVFSTVYVHVHYVTDLVAGAALAVVTLLVAPAAAGAPGPS
jgi:membrane-associated phospholipid phosphatase